MMDTANNFAYVDSVGSGKVVISVDGDYGQTSSRHELSIDEAYELSWRLALLAARATAMEVADKQLT